MLARSIFTAIVVFTAITSGSQVHKRNQDIQDQAIARSNDADAIVFVPKCGGDPKNPNKDRKCQQPNPSLSSDEKTFMAGKRQIQGKRWGKRTPAIPLRKRDYECGGPGTCESDFAKCDGTCSDEGCTNVCDMEFAICLNECVVPGYIAFRYVPVAKA
ncbi:hypothetical protein HYFRA_00006790 [Hymenoscyphus fraxineus]|uniref:WAP domain-containing protein n=1 Tax=Hymenoscyphus fraxineus TaxID=746836 RepID=A0A9N9KQP9_9HELO|nr:hypothetical protein HYFRA_00006790 [Hymenoscyphus fraxineus]